MLVIDKKNTLTFQKSFESLKDMRNYVNIRIDNDEFLISCLDDSHVCLIDLSFERNFFKKYNIEKNEIIGIDVPHFIKSMKCLDNSKDWEISTKNNQLEISSGNTIFSLNLLDIESDDITVPEQEYDIEIKIPTKKLLEILKILNINEPDNLAVCLKDIMIWETISDKGKITYKWEEDNIEKTLSNSFSRMNIDDDRIYNYSISYINKFCKNVLDDITFSFSNDFPLKINYSCDNFNCDFYLAPKIEDDEEE